MNRLLTTLLLFCALTAEATVTEFAPGTNAMVITTYDSFDIGPAGNGHFCWDISGLMLLNPTNMYRARYTGGSGQSNNGFLTNNLPAVGMPLIGAMAGTNEVFMWNGVSGNGGNTGNSNYYYTNILGETQFPMTSWTYNQRITNDFPWTTNNLHWRFFGDSCYFGATNANIGTGAGFYSNVASNTVLNVGMSFIDSTFNTIFECAVYATNQTLALELYYPTNIPPDVIQASHPQKRALQMKRHVDDFIAMGAPTNVWSCNVDWNAGTISSTNCFSTGTPVKTANTIAFSGRASRSGPPVEIADGFHTNDVRELYIFYPSYSNAFNETVTITNVPNGTWITYEGTTSVTTNVVANNTLTVNFYNVYTGNLYWQKMAALNYNRQVRDIDTNNASANASQTYMRNFSSFAGVAWPTNNSVTQYTAFMLTQEKTMETLDVSAFSAVQPITQTLTFSNASYIFPTLSAGTVGIGTTHWGQ